MAIQTSDRLAVLIDADNAQAAIAQELLTEISRYGTASVKRAYGDWTTPTLRAGKSISINLRFNQFSSSVIRPARTLQIRR